MWLCVTCKVQEEVNSHILIGFGCVQCILWMYERLRLIGWQSKWNKSFATKEDEKKNHIFYFIFFELWPKWISVVSAAACVQYHNLFLTPSNYWNLSQFSPFSCNLFTALGFLEQIFLYWFHKRYTERPDNENVKVYPANNSSTLKYRSVDTFFFSLSPQTHLVLRPMEKCSELHFSFVQTLQCFMLCMCCKMI